MNRWIYPLPEAFAPGPWTIQHTEQGGHCGREARVFAAPLHDAPFARAVRAHEHAHLRFSPSRPQPKRWGVRPDTLLAVEDARVNERAARAECAETILQLDDPTLPLPDPRVDLRRATLLLVAAHRTRAYARAWAAFEAAGDFGAIARNLATRALHAFAEPAPPAEFPVTVEVARMLDRLLGISEVPEASGLEPLLVGASAPEEKIPRGILPHAPPRWGELRRVEEPPRPIPCRRIRAVRPMRSTEEGCLLRFPHRLPVDGRVFGRRFGRPQGTVLIDASGSMHLEPKDLMKIVDAAPAAEIACYEGAAEGWGVIRVLARSGRRVADSLVKAPLGKGANVIDGPALRWLARRPEPRVWVSDGKVRGVGDNPAPELSEDAFRLCRVGGIRLVPTIEGAIDDLRAGLTRSGRRASPSLPA